MKKLLFIISFLLILLVGIFLRFYRLGSIPNSLDWDEAALGYNAYSILLTGKDEYGSFLPTAFRSFGDYKAPLYVYLTIPSIKAFGLTPFGVRFPSAFFGSLSIVIVFIFVFELFKKEKYVFPLALITMLFFAISPWSIQFSRAAFEANVALFFVITGGYLVIKGTQDDKKVTILFGILSFLLSIYTYQTEKIFVPILLLGFLIWSKNYVFKRKRFIIICVLLFVLGNGIWIFSGNAIARGTSLVFTSQQTTILQHSVKELQIDKSKNDILGIFLENRRIIYASTFFENYLSHFDPNWLFITGDLARHHAPGMGDLYILSLPFLLIGFFIFLNNYLNKAWIILYWFLIAPIASALVIGSPHALRTLVFLPTWQLFEAFGWISILSFKKWKRVFVFFIVSTLLLLNFIYYCNVYFLHTNTDDGLDWQYGYQQAVQDAYLFNRKGRTVVIDSSIQQGYIFYLFYNKIDPKWYQSQGGSFLTLHKCFHLQKVYFGSCSFSEKEIFMTAVKSNQIRLHQLKSISYLSGQSALYIYGQ